MTPGGLWDKPNSSTRKKKLDRGRDDAVLSERVSCSTHAEASQDERKEVAEVSL
jgi:hypothetical protein